MGAVHLDGFLFASAVSALSLALWGCIFPPARHRNSSLPHFLRRLVSETRPTKRQLNVDVSWIESQFSLGGLECFCLALFPAIVVDEQPFGHLPASKRDMGREVWYRLDPIKRELDTAFRIPEKPLFKWLVSPHERESVAPSGDVLIFLLTLILVGQFRRILRRQDDYFCLLKAVHFRTTRLRVGGYDAPVFVSGIHP